MSRVENPPSETEWPSGRVRSAYIEFFEKKKAHAYVPSSPVVPHEDPTLLFANAGMNQFKPIFLGTLDPSSPFAGMKRAANSQKCIRAGGKHNDLEDVGKDVYHHTFFEMLGNWSFGDYFKVEAIDWAWELLVHVYGINPERLYATYFGGNEQFGLPADEEARQIWSKYLPANRILPFGMKDNFWEMGDTGPCGPCTEIHYDRIGNRDAAHLVNMDDPDVLEIWNLVFMQFNRESATELKPLPACHVDTGMGFERLASVLQHKRSNYDTDVFTYLFEYIHTNHGCPPYQGRVGSADVDHVDMAYRVVADHVRTLTVAIGDGAFPSNTGRGYVLRRIVRRAVRYGKQFLNAETGFVSRMVPLVCAKLAEIFPEVAAKQDHIISVILEEEEQFAKTLNHGLKQFNKVVEGLKGKVVSGRDAHKLYDTFGFPVDLTVLMAAERGLSVDTKAFHECMEHARTLSEKKQGAEVGVALRVDETDTLARLGVPATQDHFKYLWSVSQATGPSLPSRVLALWNGSEFLKSANVDSGVVGLVLDRTTFYSEAGGQIADKGRIIAGAGDSNGQTPNGGEAWTNWEVEVEDVQKFGSFILHVGRVVSGTVSTPSDAVCQVDYSYRLPIASNHTATHILNWALLKHLGQEEVAQKGSLVDGDKLRFDFNHNGPVDLEKLEKVEASCVALIEANKPIYTQEVPQTAALQISSLRAVFGETYPENVRVVSVGKPVKELLADPKNAAWADLSIEFCGGTHIDRTSVFEDFTILQEEGISKGVRRLVATTRANALQARSNAKAFELRVDALSAMTDMNGLAGEVAKLRSEIESENLLLPLIKKRALDAKLVELKKKSLAATKVSGDDVISGVLAAAQNAHFAVGIVGVGDNAKALKSALDLFEAAAAGKSVMLFGVDTTKNQFKAIASVAKEHAGKLDASEWIKISVTDVCGGKGGGKADRAQGSGAAEASKLDQAVAAAKSFAKSKLG
eukprot:c32576_g1_i1.p1 GENE.c32576_g1_i1~~c32576_g1_i1.p1  ORF type:complete len:983 (+),score=229.44 c32576_g1_i1:32-2950(+)